MTDQILTEKTKRRMLILFFIGAGFALLGLRWLYFGAETVLPEDTAWKVSLTGKFDVEKDMTEIETSRPKSGRYHRLVGRNFYHPGLKLLAKKSAPSMIRMKATRTGVTELLIEFNVQLSQTPKFQLTDTPKLTVEEREKYLGTSKKLDLSLAALGTLNKYILLNVENKPQLMHKIFLHSQKPIDTTDPAFDDLENIIHSNKATALGRSRLMVALCRLNDIPARIVTGLVLDDTSTKTPYYWVEVYDEEKLWSSYDPHKGYEAEIPKNYIAFDYDNPNIFNVENGKLVSSKYTMTEDFDTLSVIRLQQEKNIFDVLNLNRLDFDTRQTLMKLLILPFCVLLTAFFRHVLGFFPYGTFTPALLALAMVYAEPVITMVVAGIVIFLALIGRSFLPDTCPRAPRLSLIFTFVAISMVFSVSFLSYFSIDAGGNIILIPTIILVAIVDRFYSYMDTSGKKAALLRLGVTMLIALFCIPILKFEQLGVVILSYPEIHLLTAGLVLMLSSYTGKKLTDNKYLRLLGENKGKKKKRKKEPEELAGLD